MEPKFQSTFIPKSPISSSAPVSMMGQGKIRKERTLLGFLASLIFGVAFLLAVGVVSYRYYLDYSISKMAVALESGRAELQRDTVSELIRLNDRILSTTELIRQHTLLSPLLSFIEASTLKSVRFTSFSYGAADNSLELSLKGEARGYAALAQQADLLQRSQNLKQVIFSDLTLDESGNVEFSLRAKVDPALLSYQRMVEGLNIPPRTNITASTTAQTGTSTAATTTPRTATSSPQR